MAVTTSLVNLPIDNLFTVSELTLDTQNMNSIPVPDSSDLFFEVDSSYRLKSGDLLGCTISEIHPAWYYSGFDYNSPFLRGQATFRDTASAKGETAFVEISNPKLELKKTTLETVECMTNINFDNGIPVQYSGIRTADRTIPTVFGGQCSSAAVSFNILAPTEIELTVASTLTEEAQFSFPVSSPRLGYMTIWGEIGEESTLPTGAVVGLVKVKSEVKFDASLGKWKSPAVEKLFTEPTHHFEYEQPQIGGSTGGYPPDPAWFLNVRDTLETIPQYVAMKNWLDGEDTEFFKFGYQHSASIVGTGIFVFQQKKTGTLPWAQLQDGYTVRRTFNAEDLPDTLVLEDAIDLTAFRSNFLNQVQGSGGGLTALPAKAVLPVCASDLQVRKKMDTTMYAGISDPLALYPIRTPSAMLQVTPLYIPQQADYHCWTPQQTYTQAYRLHNIHNYGLDDSTSLWMKGVSDYLRLHSNTGRAMATTPSRFASAHIMEVTDWRSAINSCALYLKQKFGFAFSLSKTQWRELIGTSGGSSVYRYWAGYYANWGFVNEPAARLTVGQNSTTSEPTVIPVHPYMSVMCIGKLPAGTPAGTYKFKPFRTYTIVPGALDARNAEYLKVEVTGQIKGDRTALPYWGLNIITFLTARYKWVIG